MKTLYNVSGYLKPFPCIPGLAEPVFGTSRSNYHFVAQVNEREIIRNLVKLSPSSDIKSLVNHDNHDIVTGVGRKRLYVLVDPRDNTEIVGTRKKLSRAIRKRLYTYKEYPFTQIELEIFSNSMQRHDYNIKGNYEGHLVEGSIDCFIDGFIGQVSSAKTAKHQKKPMTRADWNPVRISALITLWNEGLTTSEIGRRLGVSRNAIIGKVHRLGLPKRHKPIQKTTDKHKNIEPNFVELEKLSAGMCSWPVGEPGSEEFGFCGKRAVVERPYCEEHCARAYICRTAQLEIKKSA